MKTAAAANGPTSMTKLRRILCYGDSNTHGSAPAKSWFDSQRFDEAARWTGVLAEALGKGFRLIEEGLPGRTTTLDDPIEGASRNGLTYLKPCIDTHRPLDAIVLMLGTNDLKTRFSLTSEDIARGLVALIELILSGKSGPGGTDPRILVIAPAPIEEVGFLGEIFSGGGIKSGQLAGKYKDVASHFGAEYLNAAQFTSVSPVDGIHLDVQQHAVLGKAVADKLLTMFGAGTVL
ncbi:SGNH/GDSL hydrolase family protein [Mesorhizobium sp. M4A.F.Ca.ET.022.05.2.1]|uniref:SGNH/GDSL hydrolase family protein n=1 Tax=Mesorhizobium sp. M4A.F.Ca.ET.022.05.2.1 TaxID=2496653 RepID=UPI001AECF814|nr:SGNH/GDSL hydrolase family protein [Mesorhizobium sp. M4A.F.Ca.ET.022.05.2.1]